MDRKKKRNEFGRWIRRQREKLSLTQADLAKALNYDNPQIVSNIERGVSALPLKRIADFAQALQCEVEELEIRLLIAEAQDEKTAALLLTAVNNLQHLRQLHESQKNEEQVVELAAPAVQVSDNTEKPWLASTRVCN